MMTQLLRTTTFLALVVATVATWPYSSADMSEMEGYFKDNVDYHGGGAVIASPSTSHPDYLYHWVRDGALSMHALRLIVSPGQYDTYMKHYVSWIHKAQNQADPNHINILGEPKYFVSGSSYGKVYNRPWGRPQNDSPALRALTLMYWAESLIAAGNKSYVTSTLWIPGKMPPNAGPIKADLEYVSHNWQSSCFDPWEESNGHHFFTKMVQRASMVVGARLGKVIGDPGAAAWYEKQANALKPAITEHWDSSTGVVRESLPGASGPYKYHRQDSAVILGSLYGYANDSFYGPLSTELWSSLVNLRTVFVNSFEINTKDTKAGYPGVLFGRYPNDTYNGYQTGQKGNPWILCTQAVAQFLYRDAVKVAMGSLPGSQLIGYYEQIVPASLHKLLKSGDAKKIASALIQTGDGYVDRVKYHISGAGNHMNEELNRDTGFEQGANDLTWSYATLFTAYNERETAVTAINGL